MKKHFVTFYSPGTFVCEYQTLPIESWDVDAAMEMAHNIVERYSATPYGFQFSTRSRNEDDLDSKIIDQSPMYYLGGKIETREEVEARNDPDEEILRSNMRSNGINRIIINSNSWKTTQPFNDSDILLDWTPRK